MKNEKNAFTLIELLAIIVILAIIAVITVPIILNIIENSRKGAATDSAYGFKDSVNKYYITKLSEDRQFQLEGPYNVSDGYISGANITGSVEIPTSGTKPSSGNLHYTNNVLDGGCLVIGEYEVKFGSYGNVTDTKKGDCVTRFTVTFNLNGGKIDDKTTIDSQTVLEGTKATPVGVPGKSGYEFAGWYIDDETTFDFNSAINSNTNVYAKWDEIVAETWDKYYNYCNYDSGNTQFILNDVTSCGNQNSFYFFVRTNEQKKEMCYLYDIPNSENIFCVESNRFDYSNTNGYVRSKITECENIDVCNVTLYDTEGTVNNIKFDFTNAYTTDENTYFNGISVDSDGEITANEGHYSSYFVIRENGEIDAN